MIGTLTPSVPQPVRRPCTRRRGASHVIIAEDAQMIWFGVSRTSISTSARVSPSEQRNPHPGDEGRQGLRRPPGQHVPAAIRLAPLDPPSEASPGVDHQRLICRSRRIHVGQFLPRLIGSQSNSSGAAEERDHPDHDIVRHRTRMPIRSGKVRPERQFCVHVQPRISVRLWAGLRHVTDAFGYPAVDLLDRLHGRVELRKHHPAMHFLGEHAQLHRDTGDAERSRRCVRRRRAATRRRRRGSAGEAARSGLRARATRGGRRGQRRRCTPVPTRERGLGPGACPGRRLSGSFRR